MNDSSELLGLWIELVWPDQLLRYMERPSINISSAPMGTIESTKTRMTRLNKLHSVLIEIHFCTTVTSLSKCNSMQLKFVQINSNDCRARSNRIRHASRT